MTTIDRYLLRQYIRVFFMVFTSLLGVYVVADFVGNLAEFVDHQNAEGSLPRLLASYYGARVPWFFDIASRNVALLSAVFAIAWMLRDNELTALMGAGVSRWRVLRPLIVATAVIAVLAAVNREWALPKFRQQLCRSAQDLIRNRPEKITPRFDPQTEFQFNGENVFPREGRIESIHIRLPRTWPGLGKNLIAESARFVPASLTRPSGYLLDGVDAAATPMPEMDAYREGSQPLILTAKDFPELGPDQAFVVSQMSVDQLRRGQQWQRFTSTWKLVRGSRAGTTDYPQDIRVMMHARFLQPFLDITLVFLGLPLVVEADRRQVVRSTAKCLVALVLFGVVVIVCHGLGIQCVVSPALAAWLPLMILVPIAFLMSGPLRR